jgi:DNA-binding beta-propeller fold protein YncE
MRYRFVLGVLAVAALPTSYAVAKRMVRDFEISVPAFELVGRPLGGARPAAAAPAYLTASRIAALDDGALAIDADTGSLFRTDLRGKAVAQVAIGADAGLLAFDPVSKLAYVADRNGDKVAVVSVGEKLAIARTLKTPVEPYAVALTPDRSTLLVATIADRTLVALDTATGAERWRTAIGREPRGLAVSPDGARALVSYLVTGTIDQIGLREAHHAEHVALATPVSPRRHRFRGGDRDDDSFARASFAVTFMGENQAVVPFQRETPVQQRDGSERVSSYGGGVEPPITHQLAFIGFGKATSPQVTAQIAQHQPRALAWDGQRDALYVAGLGSDTILQLKSASTIGIAQGLTASLTRSGERCGPDGLAIAPSGDLLVWCSFSRSVHRVTVTTAEAKGSATDLVAPVATLAKVQPGPTLSASRMTQAQHAGMVLFHTADAAMAERGAMACASCHPDARADGLSWRIEKHELQTPVLAGRIVNTHPYKWDGGDKDLTTSLTMTMKRLGVRGLGTEQTAQLAAYVSKLPAVRTPTRDAVTVTRGKKLFDSAELGCRTCHDGAAFTDQGRHKLSGDLAESDTPSLLGLAASAPYFHDGSAATLEALLRDRGAVHGMSETSRMSDKDVADLVAFLETL